MGMIRKTMSIGTLGLVSFRSKSERLARAETTLGEVSQARDLERAGRVEAETKALAAEAQLKLAKHEAAVARKHASKLRKRGTRGKRRPKVLAGLGTAMAAAAKSAEPVISTGVDSARDLTHTLAAGSQQLGRRANRSARRAKKRAKPTLRSGAESAQQAAHDVAVASRKLGRTSRKSLKRAGATATDQAKHLAESAQAAVSETLHR